MKKTYMNPAVDVTIISACTVLCTSKIGVGAGEIDPSDPGSLVII